MSNELFVERAQAVHGDRYDYTAAIYLHSEKPVTVTCREHGPFEQVAGTHLRGSNCPRCAKKKHLTPADFIQKAQAAHGQRFDYSRAVYRDSATPVLIGCPAHGDYLQAPRDHWKANGCKRCRRSHNTLSKESFLQQAAALHGDAYDYSKIQYVNRDVPVEIICRAHGTVKLQKPHDHLKGRGCKACFVDRHRTPLCDVLSALHRAHGSRYDFSKLVYTSMGRRVEVVCLVHGSFFRTPADLIEGSGCPACSPVSNGEDRIVRILQELGVRFEQQVKFDTLKSVLGRSLKYDFFVPAHRLLIEFDGEQHQSEAAYKRLSRNRKPDGFAMLQENDRRKTEYAYNNGFNFLRIPYTEINHLQLLIKKELAA